jgi:signal transduction histidine kinase
MHPPLCYESTSVGWENNSRLGKSPELRFDLEARGAARHEALLSVLPDLLFELDPEGRCLAFWGPPGALAVAPEGQPIEAVFPSDAAAAVRAAMDRAAMERAEARCPPERWELELSAADRAPRTFEARLTPMASGGFLLLLRDVSDVKQAQAELAAAREAALQASRHTMQFLANISHEIRTPLNGILSVTQLLRTWSLPRDGDEYLDVLQSAGDSLLAIVSQVLDLSKIEAGKLELEVTTFDAEQLVTTASRTFFPQAIKKGLKLEVQVAPAAQGRVRGDATRMRQLVNNLVGNAVKFTDDGKVEVSLDRPVGDDTTLRLTVRDSGPGIAGELHEAIFEPFVQARDAQRRYGGTGLGLSITRRLARLMGGDVLVESDVGVGSRFTATLSMPRIEASAPLRPTGRKLMPQRPLGVLLAEDNNVNATMTSALLSKLGHTVRVVSNGQAAVEAVSVDRFDLVLMDIQMPVLDGLEATRVIRQAEKESGRHTPIVALTANAMKGDDLLCLSAGMDAYLPKPVSVEALRDVLTWFGGPG